MKNKFTNLDVSENVIYIIFKVLIFFIKLYLINTIIQYYLQYKCTIHSEYIGRGNKIINI